MYFCGDCVKLVPDIISLNCLSFYSIFLITDKRRRQKWGLCRKFDRGVCVLNGGCVTTSNKGLFCFYAFLMFKVVYFEFFIIIL